ncbi:hypothetical protein [Pedobacter insulae]|uniref:Uncharacterized protein n=1 Tax=Pedobacter insulae TaxID=414048 RepID=A0A1I2WXJ0_9SPHI|nr:hypothetical protein [Pedobacter insulae]SFH06018.1 hypothetical protein SAMN04489864_104363 [Pedobacter insulae]
MHRSFFSLYFCFLEYRISALIPPISIIIEASDLSDDFKKAYELFYEIGEKNEEHWILEGKSGTITVKFEKYESYLHLNIFTDSESKRQEVTNTVNTYLHSLEKQ